MVLKAGVQGKNSTQDVYIEEVPPGAAYIGISKLGKQKYGVENLDEKSSSISELEAKVSYNTFAPMDIYSTVQNKYINPIGDLGDGNGFSVIKYQIPANTKKIRIFNDLKTGSSILYGFYSSDDFSSSTAIQGSFGPQASASESSVYIEEVPFGATYIGLSTFSGTGYGVDVVNDKNLNNEVHELSEDIEEINGKLIFEAFDKIDASPIQYGKHISNNGNIVGDESTGFFIIPYQVPNNVKKIRITNKSRIGSFRLYGFYSSDNFSSSTVISGSLGPQANSSESDIYIVDVPYGAEYLVISVYNSDYGAESCYNIGIKAKIDSIETEIAEISDKEEIKRYAYSFDGNNLFIAYYAGNNIEYTYWFKKCMANMLFTFYRVGYRTVNRDYPSTEGIISQDGIIPINSTGSDNIGPIHCVNSAFSEKFVGGNHTVTDDDKTYKTAETKTFNIYCDDKELTSRSDGYADSIYIDVHNTVYDPSVSPVDEDATILTEPLCEEYVCYKICKTTIEVGVSHVYSSTTQNSVDNYYGMQSMFVSEDYIMTPNGIYPDWIPVGDVQHHGHIIKEDYPDFNRFIEKNTANEAYQSTYLYNDFGIGTHRMVRDSEFIFTRGDTGKDYHRMLDEYTGQVNGKVYQWRGSYTFFHIPIIDDNYVLAYMGTIYGKDALFINTKQAFSGVINVPHELTLKELSVRECFGIVDDNNGNAFQLGGNSLYIEC